MPARSYLKGWQSDRPLKWDSRRVKWYQANDPLSIRLYMEDQFGAINLLYRSVEEATEVYEKFIAGEYDCWRNKPPSTR